MADPTDPETEDAPAVQGDIAPLDLPYAWWPFGPMLVPPLRGPLAEPQWPTPWRMPAPMLTPEEAAAPAPAPAPAAAPPPPPAPAVGLAENGTVSDPEGAYEAKKHIPARALTVEEATAVLLDLKAQKALKHRSVKILGREEMSWGVTANTFKVRGPVEDPDNPPPWVSFTYDRGEACDPRLAVLMYRLATYLFVNHGVTGMETGYLREHTRAELSCHNQGRAADVFRVHWGSVILSVDECWGALPFRVNGEVARQWNPVTKEFDEGNPVLGFTNIEILVKGIEKQNNRPARNKLRQERLNKDLVVDAAIYQSLLGDSDPGPPEGWSEHTKAKAEALQVKLRKAAEVFLGMFDFFVREATISEGPDSFSMTATTTLGGQPVSRTNSGNMCIPDGTSWDYHQNHFHVQVGPTGWAQAKDSKSAQAHGDVDPVLKDFLYRRITAKILGLLDGTYAPYREARDKAKAQFEADKASGRHPADAAWEAQPGAGDLERAVAVAAGYQDQSVLKRIEGYDADKGLPEITTPVDFQTVRGRVLRRWFQGVNAAGGKNGWRQQDWLKKEILKSSLSDADARARLVAQIHADLDAWRMEITKETSIP